MANPDKHLGNYRSQFLASTGSIFRSIQTYDFYGCAHVFDGSLTAPNYRLSEALQADFIAND